MGFHTLAERARLVNDFNVQMANTGCLTPLLCRTINEAFPSVFITSACVVNAVFNPQSLVSSQLDVILFADEFWNQTSSRLRIFCVTETGQREPTSRYCITRRNIQSVASFSYTAKTLLRNGTWLDFDTSITLEGALTAAYWHMVENYEKPNLMVDFSEEYRDLQVLLEDVKEGSPDNLEVSEALLLVKAMQKNKKLKNRPNYIDASEYYQTTADLLSEPLSPHTIEQLNGVRAYLQESEG